VNASAGVEACEEVIIPGGVITPAVSALVAKQPAAIRIACARRLSLPD
jgi:hypothetical protein